MSPINVSAASSSIDVTAGESTVEIEVSAGQVDVDVIGGQGPQGPPGPQGEPGEGGGGDFLPLAGGTMTGNIVFDETGGQFIGKGLVDTERGGLYGISLVCSVGYQVNWQAGWILATEQSGSTPRPLYLDSAAGTTLRVWDAAEDEGLEVAHDGITFSDDTTQTTAWTGDQAVSTTDSVTFAGVTITGTFPALQIAQAVGLYYDSDAGYWLLDCGDEEHQGVISRFSLMNCEEIEFLDDTVQTTAWTGSFSYDDLDDLPTTYTRLSDTVSNVSYLGLAPAGSATSASAWRIKRTTIATGGTVSSSVTATNVAWNDRLTASYS